MECTSQSKLVFQFLSNNFAQNVQNDQLDHISQYAWHAILCAPQVLDLSLFWVKGPIELM